MDLGLRRLGWGHGLTISGEVTLTSQFFKTASERLSRYIPDLPSAGVGNARTDYWENQIQSKKSIELPFELTRRLLVTSEDVLVLKRALPSTPLWQIWNWARGVTDPLFLVFHGASRMAASIGTAVGLFVCIPVGCWLLQFLGLISVEQAKSNTYALWLLLVVVITFSKPSRYALTGYTSKDVDRVLDRMSELHACRRELFPAVQSCLARAEEDTKARLTTIKWVAGSVFALAVLLGQKGLDLKDGNILGYALLPLLVALFIAGFIAVHARGTVAVYGLAHAVIHKLESQEVLRQQSQALRKRRRTKAPEANRE